VADILFWRVLDAEHTPMDTAARTRIARINFRVMHGILGPSGANENSLFGAGLALAEFYRLLRSLEFLEELFQVIH
jgi:hypothetical protein